MKTLSEIEVDAVSGGNPIMAAATLAGLGMGFIASYEALTSFGSGIGAGLFDAVNVKRV